MKNIIIIALLIALIALITGCLGGLTSIGILLYQNNIKDKEISSLTTSLNQNNSKLSQANAQLAKATSDLAQRDANIISLQSSLNTMTQNYTKESLIVSKITCWHTIPVNEIKTVSTDSDLVNLITSAVESEYGIQIKKTSFLPIWNHVDTALFILQKQETPLPYADETYTVTATWNLAFTGILEGIYDVGLGCFYYLP
ncbi:MAG: hypothetical protein WCA79_21165 [Anaerolineales bacterium]